MKKLRFYFIFFFLTLAVPFGLLLRHTYSNLDQESYYFYRRAAEGLMANVQQRLQQSLVREEERPYTQYRYVHVADRPIPKQEGLNVSPLAGFPVQSEIPGILGYFQIDPDGSFHTPLLPSTDQPELVVPRRGERERLKEKLAALVLNRGISLSAGSRARAGEYRQEEAEIAKAAQDSALRENLLANVDQRLEKEFLRKGSKESASIATPEQDEKAQQSVGDITRLQKSSARQALVFDSELKDAGSDQDRDANRETDRFGLLEGEAQDPTKPAQASESEKFDDSAGFGAARADSLEEVTAEVDPFRVELVEREWLVFYRKVWWQDRRYLQGFVAHAGEFLEAHLEPALQNSPLAQLASCLIFYRGEVVTPWSSDQSPDPKPLLLYGSDLLHPLSDFHLALAVVRLPAGPGRRMVTILAVLLTLLLIGGFLGIYRLTSAQLELSQKKSDFVSAVSHELKSPLTSIRMYGEMLMEGWVQDDQKKATYYQHIHDESERLSRLIENVLRLSQLERDEWQVNLTSENPAKFVRNLAQKLNSQVRRAGFELQTVIEGKPKPIRVDNDALTQILINLIDNAIKFSKGAETREIRITVSQIGEECYIRVRDFGPGIPRRQLKKIFEKFYRIDSEINRKTRGTGIGLALVQMLAGAMDAQIDVANRRPGAEFCLRFRSEVSPKG